MPHCCHSTRGVICLSLKSLPYKLVSMFVHRHAAVCWVVWSWVRNWPFVRGQSFPLEVDWYEQHAWYIMCSPHQLPQTVQLFWKERPKEYCVLQEVGAAEEVKRYCMWMHIQYALECVKIGVEPSIILSRYKSYSANTKCSHRFQEIKGTYY